MQKFSNKRDFLYAFVLLVLMMPNAAQACIAYTPPQYNIPEDAVLTCKFESTIRCAKNLCEQYARLNLIPQYFLDFKKTEYSCPRIIGLDGLSGEEVETHFACKDKMPFTFQFSTNSGSCGYRDSFLVETGTDEAGQAASFNIDRQTGKFVSFINPYEDNFTIIKLGTCTIDAPEHPDQAEPGSSKK